MQLPIDLGYIGRLQDTVARSVFEPFGKEFSGGSILDRTVDDDVCDMNPLRAKLARHTLRQSAKRVLAPGKRCESVPATDTGRCTGKKNSSFASLPHSLRMYQNVFTFA